ncbi:hypothetical protein DFS34DRAFT_308019 [Phlyctochytrium arcticum]|nr:hypothetical protein DFS34DRAFT_308019 [Phlyctochytrium arcticum]
MPHLLAVVAALSLAANVVFVPTAAAPACGPGTVACGPACYDPKDYNCDAAQLCPKPLRGCGNACYNTSDQECKNGQLKAVNGGCGKTLRPCKDDLGGDACYDPESGDYHCVEDNLIQGPGVNLNGKIGELDDGSTLIHGEGKRKLHLINSCAFPIWVGFEGDPLPLDGGIGLGSQKKTIVQVPNNWKSARVWGRTSCHYTKDKLACATGDCGNPRNSKTRNLCIHCVASHRFRQNTRSDARATEQQSLPRWQSLPSVDTRARTTTTFPTSMVTTSVS